MKCCENVILTLRFRPGSKALDMELPSFMPMHALCDKIAESLRAMNPMAFGQMTGIRAEHNGRPLASSMTLAALGLWDGSILDIVIEGGGSREC